MGEVPSVERKVPTRSLADDFTEFRTRLLHHLSSGHNFHGLGHDSDFERDGLGYRLVDFDGKLRHGSGLEPGGFHLQDVTSGLQIPEDEEATLIGLL